MFPRLDFSKTIPAAAMNRPPRHQRLENTISAEACPYPPFPPGAEGTKMFTFSKKAMSELGL